MTDLLALTPDELLSTTRAVRKRLDLDRPVPLEVIREALAVALAGAVGLQQPALALDRSSPTRS